jgi:hypothetical protein
MARRSLTILAIVAQGLIAAEPAPGIHWRASLWALAAVSDHPMADGGLTLRPLDAGDGTLSLDGLQLGLDAQLSRDWSVRVTALAGRDGTLLQAFAEEPGNLGLAEALLICTHGAETLRLGRMWTPMGMEPTDLCAAIPASHGLLATFPLPFGLLGLEWKHAFSPSWSATLWLFNGEDRNTDNNRAKTGGLGLTYNHQGSQDRFSNLMAFSGAEQRAFGASALPGAEGRRRDRLSHNGQWVWGRTTLLWEAEYLRERFPAAAIRGAAAETTGTLSGCGFTLKRQWSRVWSGYCRAEQIQDSLGVKLAFDPAIAALVAPAPFLGSRGADLRARSFALGVERTWGPVFSRVETRCNWLNRPLIDQGGAVFHTGSSVTICVGGSFSR